MRHVKVDVGLIQDALGVDKDITDVPLRFCWEGTRCMYQELVDLSTVTLPLLRVKSNEQDLIRKIASVWVVVLTVEHRCKGMEVLTISHFSRLNQLYLFCSGGTGKQTGEAVTTHLHDIVERVKCLEDD